MVAIVHLKQNGPWGGDTLGHSPPLLTLGGEGCCETAFTAIVNALTGSSLTPRDVNEYLKTVPGAFVKLSKDAMGRDIAVPGPLINLEVAAKEYGLVAPNSARLRSHPGDPMLVKLLADTLDAGRLAIVHVDTNGDLQGEHFTAAYDHVGGNFVISDPAPGAERYLDDVNLEGTSDWAGVLKHFRAVGVAPIWKE